MCSGKKPVQKCDTGTYKLQASPESIAYLFTSTVGLYLTGGKPYAMTED